MLHKAVLLPVLVCFGIVLAQTQTGYFHPEAGGPGIDCTETDPCPNPFLYIQSNAFSEYVLAPAIYTFSSPVHIEQSFTLRWMNTGEVLLIGHNVSSQCFILNTTGSLALSFKGVTIECSHQAFYFLPFGYFELSMEDVVIQNSAGGVVIERPSGAGNDRFELYTNGLEIRNAKCSVPGSTSFNVETVDWIIGDVAFVDCCDSVVLSDSNAECNSGKITFQGFTGSGTALQLENSNLTTDLATVEFLDNTLPYIFALLSGSKWLNSGKISFQRNTATTFFTLGNSMYFYSLTPLDFSLGNEFEFPFYGYASSGVCMFAFYGPLEYYDCNYPLVLWNNTLEDVPIQFPSSSTAASLVLPLLISPPSTIDMELPLVLEMPDGLLYGTHFSIQPPPQLIIGNNTSLGLVVDIPQGAERVDLVVTRGKALKEAATLTLRVPEGFFDAPFFLSASKIHILLSPFPSAPLAYKPEKSTISITFPNSNKPDYSLSFAADELQNKSVFAQFVDMVEVDADGDVVVEANLEETEFVVQELGNTTTNLNNALPFLSFSTIVTSLLQPDNILLNLTEAIKMEVNFTMFAEEQVISFAGVEQVIPANTLKWNVLLSSWPFQHQDHALRLHLTLTSEDGIISLQTEVKNVHEQRLMLKTENTAIPFNVLPVVIVDGEAQDGDVMAMWEEVNQRVVVELPWFEQSMLLDPDMSLLLTNNEEEEKDDGENDTLWWKIVVPVLVVVIVVAVVVVVLVVVVQKWRQGSCMNKEVQAQRSVVNF